MSNTVIKVTNISKQYRLGEVGTGSISHDVNRWWSKVRGKEDPYLKIGEANDRTKKGNSDYVWALRDINFDVKQGEVLGIVGRNGAGKSTLLKILSRTTLPTTGSVKAKGRIASLLEVGTGFHPDLSGRENVFLNGAILGMTRQEIKSKFDEIVDFAGVERYIDTPVKRYSSGMYVRLAFGVAAHLEPEILIIDEVLAVGDAEFQKKALGKMKDVSESGGRTVLFVSHNMAAVKSLCTKGILLENGLVRSQGDVDIVLKEYLKGDADSATHKIIKNIIVEGIAITEIKISAKNKLPTDPIILEDEIELTTSFFVNENPEAYHITFHMYDESGEPLFSFYDDRRGESLLKGENILKCIIPSPFLNTGTYYISLLIVKNKKDLIFIEKDIVSFVVQDAGKEIGEWMGREPGYIRPNFRWSSSY